MGKLIDLTGKRFGRLQVLRQGLIEQRKRGTRTHWVCKCDCGTEKSVLGDRLRAGIQTSCGCYRTENTTKRFTKHGHNTVRDGRSGTYVSWYNMVQRCTNPNVPRWDRYGGRGIKVCAHWLVFENFLADMGERPPGLTIEREDNDGDYEPDNCCWASRAVQANNRG